MNISTSALGKSLYTITALCQLLTISTVFIGIYNDDPQTTKAENQRFDDCVEIIAETMTSEKINTRKILSGFNANTIHIGSYDQIPETYNMLLEYVLKMNNIVCQAFHLKSFIITEEILKCSEPG